MFVELGSSAAEWDDPVGGRALARAILDLRGVSPARERQVVGFGGGHYVPRFERIVRTTDWAVGHIGADWALDGMGRAENHRDLIERAFERSGATRAVIEGEKPGLRGVIDDLGYRVVSETWLHETTGVALELTERAETALGTVEEGLRFGDPATAWTPGGGEPTVERLPAALTAEVAGIDAGAARAVLACHALAFDTEESGTRPAESVLLSRDADYDRIVGEFAEILGRKYDSVERHEDELLARETAFDPEAARAAGVPDGPKFGALADGESVTIDGRVVEPETVHEEREHRFRRRA